MGPRLHNVSSATFQVYSHRRDRTDGRERSADPFSRLQLQVYCAHKFGDDHIIGKIEDFAILESSRDQGKFIHLLQQMGCVATFIQILPSTLTSLTVVLLLAIGVR